MSLKTKSIDEILKLFQEYLKTTEAQNHLKAMEKEKVEVKSLMEKISTLDKNDPEFVRHVLYGLIPHSKTKVAIRASHFPAVYDIKSYLKCWSNYSDEDWKNIAQLIYRLASSFQEKPEDLEKYVEEYARNPYNKGMQCGTISPILFAINDSFPLINNPVKRTYSSVSHILGHQDELGSLMKDYPQNVIKLQKFVEEINSDLLRKQDQLDLFCYWFDNKTHYTELAKKRKAQKKRIESSEDEVKLETFNLPKFIETIDLKKPISLSSHKDPDTDERSITKIISDCQDTRWVLPHFQRYFDWKKDDIKDFLRAIFNDYYVGAFLLWKADKEPEVKVQAIKGVQRDQLNADAIVLDGQQRISSLIYAISAPKIDEFNDKSKWKDTKIYRDHPVYFYIDFKEFFTDPNSQYLIKTRRKKIPEKECFESLLFPFYELEKYGDWVAKLEWHLRDFSSDHKKIYDMKELIRKKLANFWEDFEIPYILLPKNMGIHQVTEIFEQLNTKGKPLSVFDLLIARLYKFNIKLKDLWDLTQEQHRERIFRYSKKIEKIPIYILQSMSLVYDKNSSAKRADILNIYTNIYEKNDQYVFEEHWNEMANYMNTALKKMENFRDDGFGVRSEGEVPFAPMIPVLTGLLRLIDEQANKKNCYEKLKKWYWSSVFTNSYSSAADSQMTKDYKEMKKWFNDDNQIPQTVKEMMNYEISRINLREVRTKSNAKYKGVMSLLALEGAKDFDTSLTLENARANDQDHLFPKSMKLSSGQTRFKNSVLNMTWMSKGTNRTIKKFDKPSIYVKDFISKKFNGNEKEFIEVLKTHMINEKAYSDMLKNDFNGFLVERERVIIAKIAKLLGIEEFKKESKLISPKTPFTNKKILWDTLRTCNGYIHWVDKYFSKAGLETFIDAEIDPQKVREIRILMAAEKVTDKFKKHFTKFKIELENQGISCEARMITEKSIKDDIHDRWILAENCAFNVASTDVIARGQYSEIKATSNRPPFEKWWENSEDINKNHQS